MRVCGFAEDSPLRLQPHQDGCNRRAPCYDRPGATKTPQIAVSAVWRAQALMRRSERRLTAMISIGTQSTDEPSYYLAREVAAKLRCSEWWVKEQARNQRIPYSWIGGSYRFTAEHIEQIVTLFERRPTGARAASVSDQTHARRPKPATSGQVVRLTARRPRRARRAAS
jgi:hypothetical protein